MYTKISIISLSVVQFSLQVCISSPQTELSKQTSKLAVFLTKLEPALETVQKLVTLWHVTPTSACQKSL